MLSWFGHGIGRLRERCAGAHCRCPGGRLPPCRFGSAVGGGVTAGVLDAGDQDAGGLASGGEFALSGGFLEELVEFVAAGFGVGEDGGEGLPGGVGEDAVGVIGDGGPDVMGQSSTGLLARLTSGEGVDDRGEGVVGGGV